MSSSRINVYIRVRPTIKEDVNLADGDDRELKECIYVDESRKILTVQPQQRFLSEKRSFKFNHIFPPFVGQKEVFDTVALPLLYDALTGLNCCLLCFGQTGSGKTHSLFSSNFSNNRFDFSMKDKDDWGIIPRMAKHLFEEISENTEIKVSFTQLYCGIFLDLINPHKKNLVIREKPNNIFVENLSEKVVKTPEHLLKLIEKSSNNRIVSNTRMNLNSSRSHVLFIIKIKQFRGNKIIKSKLTLVDLAGNEKLRKTKSKGKRLEECQFINKSLSTLGLCINSLILRDQDKGSERKSSKRRLNNTLPIKSRGKSRGKIHHKTNSKHHIPFRDSKLTRILTDSLNGKSRCSILCTLSTPQQHYEESLSTLFFALRAQCIRVKPKVNEEINNDRLQTRLDGLVKENRVLVEKNIALQKNNINLKRKISEKKKREMQLQRVVKRYENSSLRNSFTNSSLSQSSSPYKDLNNSLRSNESISLSPGKDGSIVSGNFRENTNMSMNSGLDEGTFENLIDVFSKSKVFKEKFLEKVIGTPTPQSEGKDLSKRILPQFSVSSEKREDEEYKSPTVVTKGKKRERKEKVRKRKKYLSEEEKIPFVDDYIKTVKKKEDDERENKRKDFNILSFSTGKKGRLLDLNHERNKRKMKKIIDFNDYIKDKENWKKKEIKKKKKNTSGGENERNFSPVKKREFLEKEKQEKDKFIENLYKNTDFDYENTEKATILDEIELPKTPKSHKLSLEIELPIEKEKEEEINYKKNNKEKNKRKKGKFGNGKYNRIYFDQTENEKDEKVEIEIEKNEENENKENKEKEKKKEPMLDDFDDGDFLQEYERLQKEHEMKLKQLEESEKLLLTPEETKEPKKIEPIVEEKKESEEVNDDFEKIRKKYLKNDNEENEKEGENISKRLNDLVSGFDEEQDQLELVEKRWKLRMERIFKNNKKIV